MVELQEKEAEGIVGGLMPQCKDCHYYRYIHNHGKAHFRPKCCHYILDEGELTVRENGNCLSYKPRRVR